jgi:AAA15 family ATPase/GTPase
LVGKILAIRFQNYKRLKNFSIRAQQGNIFVGPNNSGKSSILDAFRLLEAGLRYSRSKRPRLLDTPAGIFDGYEVPESACPFHLTNAITNYGDEDAIIEFDHENGSTAIITLNNDRSVRFIINANGKRFATSKQFRESFPVELVIVPTLAPLESEENLVQPTTVQRNRTTRLAARNFRNIWHLESQAQFDIFRERVERAWDGVRLQQPELIREMPPRIEMYFEENRVTREIQWAGFGFQVWLQIHTHLGPVDVQDSQKG